MPCTMGLISVKNLHSVDPDIMSRNDLVIAEQENGNLLILKDRYGTFSKLDSIEFSALIRFICDRSINPSLMRGFMISQFEVTWTMVTGLPAPSPDSILALLKILPYIEFDEEVGAAFFKK